MTHHRHDHQHENRSPDVGGLSDMLDLDAEVLAGPLDAVRDDIAALADGPVRRILDLGAGAGAGTFGLLRRFPDAQAVAVDGSVDLLEHLQDRAEHLGLADRVTTVHADLDHALPTLEPADLAWASASLHHLADPDRTLAQIAAALRPGGLLAVVELTGFPRFLPDDTPAGAAEAAAHGLLAADRATDMPAMGSDWASRLGRAGLGVELDRAVVVDLVAPLPASAGAYAFATLTRIRATLTDRLDPVAQDDLDRALDGGPGDVRRRSDLRVRTQRQLHVARRPAP